MVRLFLDLLVQNLKSKTINQVSIFYLQTRKLTDLKKFVVAAL